MDAEAPPAVLPSPAALDTTPDELAPVASLSVADAGGIAAVPAAAKVEPGSESAPEPAAAAAEHADAAEPAGGHTGDIAIKAEGEAEGGAVNDEEEAQELPPLPSTVQLLQESCGWTVNGRIEVQPVPSPLQGLPLLWPCSRQ